MLAISYCRVLEKRGGLFVILTWVIVSVGTCISKLCHDTSYEEYLKRADEALYQAKKNGRNQVQSAKDEIEENNEV